MLSGLRKKLRLDRLRTAITIGYMYWREPYDETGPYGPVVTFTDKKMPLWERVLVKVGLRKKPEYLWRIFKKPPGSVATGVGTKDSVTFTPDISGVYVVGMDKK